MEKKNTYNKLAIGSAIVAILAIYSMIVANGQMNLFMLLYLVGVVSAFILGILGLKEIRRTGEKGKIIAYFGLFLSGLHLFLVFSIVLLAVRA